MITVINWIRNLFGKNKVSIPVSDTAEPFKIFRRNGEPLERSLYIVNSFEKKVYTKENGLAFDFQKHNGWTFIAGKDSVFATGDFCNFITGDDCAFKTGSYCVFQTGKNCAFDTLSNCSFITKDKCDFSTGFDCKFKTGKGCTFKELKS